MFDLRINNMLAENFLIGEELAAEGFIDDGYSGSVRSVLRRKATPAQQRNFQCREIVFPDHLPVGDVVDPGLFCLAGQ